MNKFENFSNEEIEVLELILSGEGMPMDKSIMKNLLNEIDRLKIN